MQTVESREALKKKIKERKKTFLTAKFVGDGKKICVVDIYATAADIFFSNRAKEKKK